MNSGLSGVTPPALPAPPSSALPAPPGMAHYAAGGLVRMVSNAQLDADARNTAQQANNQPVIQGLAAHVRQCWSVARMAKMNTVEARMLQAVRQRRGQYDPDVLAEIRKGGGSEVYMMLTSNKCRAGSSWLRDVLLGSGKDKPWTVEPTPLPDLPPAIAQTVAKMAYQEAMAFSQQTGQVVGEPQMQEVVSRIKDRIVAGARKKAKEACERMERKMEDQLDEGNFPIVLGQFIEDIVTFPSALLKGPVVRNKPKLSWDPNGQSGYQLMITTKLVLEWERVDPFMAYPSPEATTVDDGFFIERHKLSRQNLNDLLGVEGYNDEAIRAVLVEHGRNGLKDWLYIDAAKAEVEGKSLSAVYQNPDGIIDGLQYWGSVQGKLLVEWGMDPKSVPDELKEYQCEVWVIGQWVIKATLNPDPLGRRPYYKASYEEIPGTFWGNAITDLCRDTQTQCNTAARAIANNMNIASGPQVMFNVDRLPAGEDITQVYPWKVWQATSDPYGSTADPVKFFMPSSIAGELMQIYTFFSNLADEHTGVPRYMTGDQNVGGAGRTASGMSMLMNNAGKAIKQVVANIDDNVLGPAIERLYFYNMRYGEDPELKGDVNVVARGAESIIVKEQAQVRINEFLNMVMSNPMYTDIVGEEAVAELLRQAAKQLDLVDVDSVVPPPEIIRQRLFLKQQAAAQQEAKMIQLAMQGIELPNGPQYDPQHSTGATSQPKPKTMPGNKQRLGNGAAITDNFAPARTN